MTSEMRIAHMSMLSLTPSRARCEISHLVWNADLVGKLAEVTWLAGDGFSGVPSEEDYEFWCHAAAAVNGKAPALLAIDSSDLCHAVNEELECVDVTEVRPGHLYLGETSAVESRLALAMLNIKGIVVVTDSDRVLEGVASWSGLDTYPITPSVGLAEQLDSCISFAQSVRGACLVCSGDGNGAAAVVCAAVLAAEKRLGPGASNAKCMITCCSLVPLVPSTTYAPVVTSRATRCLQAAIRESHSSGRETAGSAQGRARRSRCTTRLLLSSHAPPPTASHARHRPDRGPHDTSSAGEGGQACIALHIG